MSTHWNESAETGRRVRDYISPFVGSDTIVGEIAVRGTERVARDVVLHVRLLHGFASYRLESNAWM